MEAIARSSPPILAPDSIKLPTPATAPVSVPKESQAEQQAVDIALSNDAKEYSDTKPKGSIAEQAKAQQDKKTQEEAPPSPSLGKEFYEQNQIQAEKSKAARQEALKETAKYFSNYLQYTNSYLAQLAYAKQQADQPIILPQTSGPQDLIAKLNLFA